MQQSSKHALRRRAGTEYRLWVRRRPDQELSGVAEYLLTGERYSFTSVMDLFHVHESINATTGMLRPTHSLRNWMSIDQERKIALSPRLKKNETPAAATFMLRIQYARNATWQGVIEWLEKGESVPFRSAMEMLHLIERAVDASDLPGDEDVEPGMDHNR